MILPLHTMVAAQCAAIAIILLVLEMLNCCCGARLRLFWRKRVCPLFPLVIACIVLNSLLATNKLIPSDQTLDQNQCLAIGLLFIATWLIAKDVWDRFFTRFCAYRKPKRAVTYEAAPVEFHEDEFELEDVEDPISQGRGKEDPASSKSMLPNGTSKTAAAASAAAKISQSE